MTYLHISALITLLLFLYSYKRFQSRQTICSKFFTQNGIFLLLLAGFFLRLFLAGTSHGFTTDITCFGEWADRIFAVGPGKFYSQELFTDYPPGMMYLLYVLGALRAFLQLPSYSTGHILLLKLPSIICDLVCCYLLYREAVKRFDNTQALCLVTVYLFNPAVILNSSLWGQVDSIFTVAILLLCFFLSEGKLWQAYLVFGIGILLKPQTLIFTPVLLVGIGDQVLFQNFSVKKLLRHLLSGCSVIAGILLLCMPFGLQTIFSQYQNTLASYPYASVNAYNFWSLQGLNWASQDTLFLGIGCKFWGYLVILLIVAVSFVIGWRNSKDNTKYFLIGAFIILTMFLFSVRMHERYMYPGLILLLCAYMYKPIKATYLCYTGFSLLHFYNTAHVLFYYNPSAYNPKAAAIIFVSLGMVLCIIYFYHIILHYYSPQRKEEAMPQKKKLPKDSFSKESFPKGSLSKIDLLLLSVITLLYSAFALHDLGDNYAPATTYDMAQNESILLDFGEERSPASLSYYIAPWHDRHFSMEVKNTETDAWSYAGEITLQNVFTWQTIPLENIPRFLKLTLTDTQASLLDITFKDASGAIITPLSASAYPALFDENNMCPEQSTFRNSMYFDEIYHGRTAYEFIHGLTTYENTHPPLGKGFIAMGVWLFGMNPFGWRIMGTLFGIAMLPLLYLFGKRMTDSTPAAALACFIFAFDFMHFVQTRIATIDVYITFFVILMYYLMYRYCTLTMQQAPFRQTRFPLGACGIAFGLGVACKWTGLYAGAGLALIFFVTLFQYAPKKAYKTIKFCMLFFVAIPFAIYTLSYLPFVDAAHPGLFDAMFANQTSMLQYHSSLAATHPFSSAWYEWPTIHRPIWYYSHIVSDTLREGISAFGNPFVWWLGIPAFPYMAYLFFRKKDFNAGFLLTGYLAQYLPWFFVTRITFIYHYFPSVPFVVLMIVYSFTQLQKKLPHWAFMVCIITYAAAVFGLFALFYPVLAGQPIAPAFVDIFLRWSDSWVLIAD